MIHQLRHSYIPSPTKSHYARITRKQAKKAIAKKVRPAYTLRKSDWVIAQHKIEWAANNIPVADSEIVSALAQVEGVEEDMYCVTPNWVQRRKESKMWGEIFNQIVANRLASPTFYLAAYQFILG